MNKKQITVKIIEYIEEQTNVKLPDFGYIAGQSVAEAYFRVTNTPIYTRIKDVDLFLNSAELYLTEKTKSYIKTNYKKIYSYSDKKVQVFQNKINSNNYNNNEETLLKLVTKFDVDILSIKQSIDIGKLNVVDFWFIPEKYKYSYKIGIKKNHSQIYILKKLLEYFDVNSVKIGICLKTKQLVMLDEFNKFLKTKNIELNIKDIYKQKPLKSYIRILKKAEYYKGIYFNKEYELNLAYIAHKLSGKKKEVIVNNQYKELSEYNKIYLKKYLKINEDKRIHIIKNKYLKKFKMLFQFDFIIKELEQIKFEKFQLNGIILKTLNKNKLISLKEMKEFIEKNYSQNYQYIYDVLLSINNDNSTSKNIPQQVRNYINSGFKCFSAEQKIVLVFSKKISELIEIKTKPYCFNKQIKENLRLFNKYITPNLNNTDDTRYSYFQDFIIFQRDFQTLFFTKKIQIMIDKNLFILISKNINNSLSQLLNKPKSFLKVFFNHLELFKKYRLLCDGLNIELNYQYFYERIFYLETVEIDLIGYIESNSDVYILIEEDKEFNEYIHFTLDKINKEKEELKSKKGPIKFNIPKNKLLFSNYQIFQIIDGYSLKKEGNGMHHCIAGYTRRLLEGKIIVFKVFDENNNRYTLAFSLKNTKISSTNMIKLDLMDFKLKYNGEPKQKIKKDMDCFKIQLEQYLNKKD